MLVPPNLEPPLEGAQQVVGVDAWAFGLQGLEISPPVDAGVAGGK